MVSATSDGLGAKAMGLDSGHALDVGLHVDASAAIGVAQRKGLGRTRHLDTQRLWIQDAVRSQRVSILKVPGSENPADCMTKHLYPKALNTMIAKMSLVVLEGRATLAPRLIGHGGGEAKVPGHDELSCPGVVGGNCDSERECWETETVAERLNIVLLRNHGSDNRGTLSQSGLQSEEGQPMEGCQGDGDHGIAVGDGGPPYVGVRQCGDALDGGKTCGSRRPRHSQGGGHGRLKACSVSPGMDDWGEVQSRHVKCSMGTTAPGPALVLTSYWHAKALGIFGNV